MKQAKALFSLRYQLTPEQTQEALRLILDRRGKPARMAAAAVLLLLTIGLWVHGCRTSQTAYTTLAVYSAIIALLVYSYPGVKARWSARKLSKRNGWYQLDFYPDGTIGLPDGSRVVLRGDKGCRGFVTKTVYALRPDRFHTFCIPVSVLSSQQREDLNVLLRANLKVFYEM